MKLAVASTAERPDLVPTVAGWLRMEFRQWGARPLAETMAAVAATVTSPDLPRTFILLADGEPVGTASLAASDMEERPALSPWLAGVLVVPAARGRGHAARLVAAVEDECRRRSISTLWLYTRNAERIYARCGWRTVETIGREAKVYALMRRDLEPGAGAKNLR